MEHRVIVIICIIFNNNDINMINNIFDVMNEKQHRVLTSY